MYRITAEASKYGYVSSSLPPEVAERVSDFIFSPPAAQQYTLLCKRILDEYADSNSTRIKKLLDQCELGDGKASTFIRKMRTLAQGEVSDSVLLHRVMSSLPEHIAAIIAAGGITDLDKVGDAADKALEVTSGRSSVAAVRATREEPTIRDLQAQIASLAESVKRLTGNQPNRRSRSRSRAQSPHSRARSKSRDSSLCWYHNTFREKAVKCQEPCSWSSTPKPQPQENSNVRR